MAILTNTNELTLVRDHEIVTDSCDVRISAASAIECAVRGQPTREVAQIAFNELLLIARAWLHIAETTASRPIDAVIERHTDLADRIVVARYTALSLWHVADGLGEG